HMQLVWRKECLEWNTIDFIPMPHETKAVKQVDVLLHGGARNQINHVFNFRLSDHLRRELWIDQNDIGADRLHSPYTVANQPIGFRMFISSEYGVGAHLPEHQVWMLG